MLVFSFRDDDGKELFGKRGSEFKLPYPIIDADPSGYGIAMEEEELSKIKTSSKRGKTAQGKYKEYLQTGRKRKAPYRDVAYSALPNGYANAASPYSSISTAYPGYTDMKTNDFISPYTPAGSNLALETAADLYRSSAYTPFAAAAASGMYPTADSLRFDMDRQAAYANGYYFDSVTRQYQHSLPYTATGYSDLISHSKYPYDMSKYGYDSLVASGYGLDLTKRSNYYDTSTAAAYRGYDATGDKYSRVNGSYDNSVARKTSAYDTNGSASVTPLTSAACASLDASQRDADCLHSATGSGEYKQQEQTQAYTVSSALRDNRSPSTHDNSKSPAFTTPRDDVTAWSSCDEKSKIASLSAPHLASVAQFDSSTKKSGGSPEPMTPSTTDDR